MGPCSFLLWEWNYFSCVSLLLIVKLHHTYFYAYDNFDVCRSRKSNLLLIYICIPVYKNKNTLGHGVYFTMLHLFSTIITMTKRNKAVCWQILTRYSANCNNLSLDWTVNWLWITCFWSKEGRKEANKNMPQRQSKNKYVDKMTFIQFKSCWVKKYIYNNTEP